MSGSGKALYISHRLQFWLQLRPIANTTSFFHNIDHCANETAQNASTADRSTFYAVLIPYYKPSQADVDN